MINGMHLGEDGRGIEGQLSITLIYYTMIFHCVIIGLIVAKKKRKQKR